MRSLLLVALIVAVSSHPEPKKWAVLVSGSKGYGNYRHQANVCHSYQVLIDRGFDPDHIILFSYNDVPFNPSNPYPGRLFNRPDMPGDPAVNVNLGCKKDYTGIHVTPTNFYKVLTGNSAAMAGIGTGKVLKSNKFDRVFIFFTGLGGNKFIRFPNASMTSNNLLFTFQTMAKKEMYKKMVIYLDSSKSGSMFEGLLNPSMNILAVTAAKPTGISYPEYCPPNDVVGGIHINSCLGTIFGVTWMEDADEMIDGETLLDQIIKLSVATSGGIGVYGDTDFILDTLGLFIGEP